MKQNKNKFNHESGFTLIELLVVIGIMVLLTGAIVIDFNRQKTTRNIVLAKNETVTNLRKVQSYMLSSKNISGDLAAKFYILELRSGASTYTINAVDSDFNYHGNLETVTLPSTVSFTSLTSSSSGQFLPEGEGSDAGKPDDGFGEGVFGGEGDKGGGETPIGSGGGGGGTGTEYTYYNCVQIIFSAPFGTMYARGADTCGSDIVDVLRDPVQLAQLSQQTIYLNFIDTPNVAGAKYIQVSPVTGQITAF